MEAEYQVRRLRNRPSMAVWSGNNEVQLIHGFAYQGYEPGDWGWHFFHKILPETVERFDGAVPYWPGSPWGEDDTEGWMAVNGVRDGDRHAWEVWHGFDFGAGGGPYDDPGQARHHRRYANDLGKFVSEFGIHAAPELTTLERWIPAGSLSYTALRSTRTTRTTRRTRATPSSRSSPACRRRCSSTSTSPWPHRPKD